MGWTLIFIAFSKSLCFDNLTLTSLFDWYISHPFLFMLAFSEIVRLSALDWHIILSDYFEKRKRF